MITLSALISNSSGLERNDLERWIVETWVKPETDGVEYLFHDVDVARVRLIQELRDELEIDEAALPVVLLLLDQVYDLRRRMRQVVQVLRELSPDDIQRSLADELARSWRNPYPL